MADDYRVNIDMLKNIGKTVSDVFLMFGINQVNIYGYGKNGRILINDLDERIEVLTVVDKNVSEYASINNREIEISTDCSVLNNGKPIIVTPQLYYEEIERELYDKGIDSNRLWSLNVIMRLGVHCLVQLDKDICLFNSKMFLITGAGLANIGAQAMLFTMCSEIRKRDRNAIIWCLMNNPENDYSQQMLDYDVVFLQDGRKKGATVNQLWSHLSAVYDVSGYAFNSNRGWGPIERVLFSLENAHRYGIPMYLMPQSFGPMEFDDSAKQQIKRSLKYARVIYAREKAGYELLRDGFGLCNVYIANDLVIQSRELVAERIYIRKKITNIYDADIENGVAIIPNIQNYKFRSKEAILKIYKDIIDRLERLNKKVYIISRTQDHEIACDIHEICGKTVLIDNGMDCFDYKCLMSKFQYVIASRYHSIVLSYKEGIPCLVLGWADKYKSLMSLFSQDKYLFDVRDDINDNFVIDALERLEEKHKFESNIIKNRLIELEDESCFIVIDHVNSTFRGGLH